MLAIGTLRLAQEPSKKGGSPSNTLPSRVWKSRSPSEVRVKLKPQTTLKNYQSSKPQIKSKNKNKRGQCVFLQRSPRILIELERSQSSAPPSRQLVASSTPSLTSLLNCGPHLQLPQASLATPARTIHHRWRCGVGCLHGNGQQRARNGRSACQ